MWVYNNTTLLSCCGKDSQAYSDTLLSQASLSLQTADLGWL